MIHARDGWLLLVLDVIFPKSTLSTTNSVCSDHLRLQSYPRGLGKGSDSAVIGAWLDAVMKNINPNNVPATWLWIPVVYI